MHGIEILNIHTRQALSLALHAAFAEGVFALPEYRLDGIFLSIDSDGHLEVVWTEDRMSVAGETL